MLSSEYLENEEENVAKFIEPPSLFLSDSLQTRLYRAGDLVREGYLMDA